MVTALLLGFALLLWPGSPPGDRLRQRWCGSRPGALAGSVSVSPVSVSVASASAAAGSGPTSVAGRGDRWQADRSRRMGRTRAVLAPAAAALVTGLVVGTAAGVAAGAIVSTLWHLVRAALARRRGRRELTDLTAGLRLLARELRAGSAVEAAVHLAAAESRGVAVRVLTGLVDAVGLSRSDGASRTEPIGAGPRPGRARADVAEEIAARLRTGWVLSNRYGVSLATVVEATARDLSDATAAADARAGQVAGPATSGYVMSGLPLAGLLLGSGMGADPWRVLTQTGAGGVLLVAGTALACAGLLWSARIVRP